MRQEGGKQAGRKRERMEREGSSAKCEGKATEELLRMRKPVRTGSDSANERLSWRSNLKILHSAAGPQNCRLYSCKHTETHAWTHISLLPDDTIYFLSKTPPLSRFARFKHGANSPLIGGSSSDFHDNTPKCKKRT